MFGSMAALVPEFARSGSAAWRSTTPDAMRIIASRSVAPDGEPERRRERHMPFPLRRTGRLLMRRVFAIDVLECPRSGSRMSILAVIRTPEASHRNVGMVSIRTDHFIRRPVAKPDSRVLPGAGLALSRVAVVFRTWAPFSVVKFKPCAAARPGSLYCLSAWTHQSTTSCRSSGVPCRQAEQRLKCGHWRAAAVETEDELVEVVT